MKSYVQELRKGLCDIINQSPLNIDVKFYIVKDVLNELNDVLDNFLNTPEPESLQANDNNKHEQEEQKHPKSGLGKIPIHVIDDDKWDETIKQLEEETNKE